MSIVLPSLQGPKTPAFEFVKQYTEPVRRPVEPVGRHFLAHATRTLRGHTWSEFEKLEAEKNVKKVEENEDADLGDEEQSAELLAHDPREWKEADLYAVLGLSHLRYKATEDQIRRAHRKQVLKHHPDKKSASGGLEQDGFFKIIQKAFDVMLDPSKRQQFDSVDENATVPPPAPKHTGDFFEAWGPVFETNAHFSKKQPVPLLGNADSSKEEVDAFYRFWGHFDSWKSFEFKDEDVPDDTANRDHKRYIERKNISNRKKLKQEDNKALNDIVSRAQAEDPRIKAFKDAAKKEKERLKWEREAGSRAAAEKKAAEEAAKKKAEEEEAKNKVDSKKAKEAAKSAKKKNKRAIRNAPKDSGYFGEEGSATAIDSDIDLLLEKLNDLQLAETAQKLGADGAEAKSVLAGVFADLTADSMLNASHLKYFK